jgi:Ca2+-binding RTX toxin-like protein
MAGGKGDDSYTVLQAGDKATEAANEGFDTVVSTLASFTLGANIEALRVVDQGLNGTGNGLDNEITGNSNDNALDGGGGNDFLFGDEGLDSLQGGTGNDFLEGGADADALSGGAGNDTLAGGAGADALSGDAGIDTFRYDLQDPDDAAELAALGGDTIAGFQSGVDKIDLSDLLDDFGVDLDRVFSSRFVQLVQNGADTLVQFDSDGVGLGGAAPVTLATVTNATVLQSDIILVSNDPV